MLYINTVGHEYIGWLHTTHRLLHEHHRLLYIFVFALNSELILLFKFNRSESFSPISRAAHVIICCSNMWNSLRFSRCFNVTIEWIEIVLNRLFGTPDDMQFVSWIQFWWRCNCLWWIFNRKLFQKRKCFKWCKCENTKFLWIEQSKLDAQKIVNIPMNNLEFSSNCCSKCVIHFFFWRNEKRPRIYVNDSQFLVANSSVNLSTEKKSLFVFAAGICFTCAT